MKINRKDKMLLFEQEFITLLLIVGLGLIFHYLQAKPGFYMATLLIGFALYFWMIYEEKIHRSGKKHDYFEHTSSYIMVAQTATALELVSKQFDLTFLFYMCLVVAVIMYSVSLSRILMFKLIFKDLHEARLPK